MVKLKKVSYTSHRTQEKAFNFEIEGGRKLHGTIVINTSKNGALVLLCASLLNKGETILHNIPKIEEVHRVIEVLESIGVTVLWRGHTVIIRPPQKLTLSTIDKESAERTRSIIMFLGPLLHHMSHFSLPQSGGCKLGGRTVRPHFYALEPLGVSIKTTEHTYEVRYKKLRTSEIIMYESGDTATENVIMAAALIPGVTTIKYASANYQVQELCFFLEKAGIVIDGIGTTTLHVHGVEKIDTKIEYSVSEDPTDAMFFLATAIVTKSSITLKRCPIDFLELELLKLEKMGFRYNLTKPYLSKNEKTRLVDLTTQPSVLRASPEKIYGRPYPGLNIDNLPFFAVIATQAKGTTLIHDWAYEKRALYYTELDKLGANTTLADPHRIFITGITEFKSADLVCPPALRPATLLLVGMLAAKGHSTLRNIYNINRGYEDLPQKLSSLGAKIRRIST
ncbi:MAG TPA: UDP-N-acetylglucosamine 1-carboxyvinyltransferase [Candidatus Paceibacterota bacterium]